MDSTDRLEKAWKTGPKLDIDDIKLQLAISIRSKLQQHDDFSDPDGEKLFVVQGHRGVGKSALWGQLEREYGIKVVKINLGGTLAEDLHGNPYIKKVGEENVTTHAPLEMLPCFREAVEYGVIVFEEGLSNTSKDAELWIRQMCGRVVDGHKMLPGWHLAITTNPQAMEYSLVRQFDASTLDRFVILNAGSSREGRLRYWRDKMYPPVYNFLLNFSFAEANFFEDISPRAWWNLSIEIAKREVHLPRVGDNGVSILIATNAGGSVAVAYEKYKLEGDDPDKRPESGVSLLTGDKLEERLKRLQRWAVVNNTPLLSATAWDIADCLKKDPGNMLDGMIDNLARTVEMLCSNGNLALLDVILRSISSKDYMPKVLERLDKTDTMARLRKALVE